MSDSHKLPYIGWGSSKKQAHAKAKKNMKRKIRRTLKGTDELVDGAYYKKYLHSWRWRPDDGKHYMPGEPRAYRK